MKITNKLEQFSEKKVLFLVTGKQDARAYIATNGVIDRVISFRVQKPAYTDNEGRFGNRSRGRSNIIQTGNVLRPVDRSIRLNFRHELNEKIKELIREQDIDEIIFFGPKHYQDETISLLPKRTQSKITAVISGNYFEKHPFELITKWQKQERPKRSKKTVRAGITRTVF